MDIGESSGLREAETTSGVAGTTWEGGTSPNASGIPGVGEAELMPRTGVITRGGEGERMVPLPDATCVSCFAPE